LPGAAGTVGRRPQSGHAHGTADSRRACADGDRRTGVDGFAVVGGNNVHLNLEPDTRAEADRLFNALAAGGEIDMPLQDMFWGAYFGSLTDRFGIRWMVNFAQPT